MEKAEGRSIIGERTGNQVYLACFRSRWRRRSSKKLTPNAQSTSPPAGYTAQRAGTRSHG